MPATTLIARVAAILLLAAGALHVSAAVDHIGLQEMLALFVTCASLQVLLGAALLVEGPGRGFVLTALAVTVGAIGAWLLSRTVGLPLVPDGHKEPIGFKDGITVLLELGAVPALLLLLSPEISGIQLRSRLPRQAFATLAVGVLALMVAALTLGPEHSDEEGHAVGDGLAHRAPAVHQAQEHRAATHNGPTRHKRHPRDEVASVHRSHAPATHVTHSPAAPTHGGGHGGGTQREHAGHRGHERHDEHERHHGQHKPPKQEPPRERPGKPEKQPPPSDPPPPDDDSFGVTIDPGGDRPVVVDLPPR